MRAAHGVVVVASCALACGGRDSDRPPPPVPPDVPVPVALNADSPFGYPPALYEAGVTGEVVLRLYVDSTGRLVPESTRVAEPSGHPALDSAALAGAPALRFAPATRRGVTVGATFLQPVRFRRPGAATPAPAGGPPDDSAPPAPPRRRSTPRPTPPPVPADTGQRPDTTRRQRADSAPRPAADTTPRRDSTRVDSLRPPIRDTTPRTDSLPPTSDAGTH